MPVTFNSFSQQTDHRWLSSVGNPITSWQLRSAPLWLILLETCLFCLLQLIVCTFQVKAFIPVPGCEMKVYVPGHIWVSVSKIIKEGMHWVSVWKGATVLGYWDNTRVTPHHGWTNWKTPHEWPEVWGRPDSLSAALLPVCRELWMGFHVEIRHIVRD